MTREKKIQKMIDTGIVTISNDPLVSGFGREVRFANGFIWQPQNKTIQLDFMVHYVGEDVPARLRSYSVTLVANTIDTGDGNEYQDFVDLAQDEIKIFELIYDTIMLRDSQGKFNK